MPFFSKKSLQRQTLVKVILTDISNRLIRKEIADWTKP